MPARREGWRSVAEVAVKTKLKVDLSFLKKNAYLFIFGCAGSLLLNLAFLWGFPHSSVGKESTCNAGNPSSIPGSGRSAGKGIGYPLQYSWASLVAQLVKNPACNEGDLGLIPGLGRSSGEGKGYPRQYPGLMNSMDCIICGVTKNWT